MKLPANEAINTNFGLSIAVSLGSISVRAVESGPWILHLAAEPGGDTIKVMLKVSRLANWCILRQASSSVFAGNPVLQSEFTVGYKVDLVNAKYAAMSFKRVTLNVMQYYRNSGKFRSGLGVTNHMNPTFESGALCF